VERASTWEKAQEGTGALEIAVRRTFDEGATMSHSYIVMPALILAVMAFALADLRRVAKFRLTYGLAWGIAIAIALGCGFLIG
jgi:hypothetical protein